MNKIDPRITETIQSTHRLEGIFEKILNLETTHAGATPQETEEKPLLSSFIDKGLLPEGYALSSQQEELIKDLFRKRVLDSQICLIDLLGLEIHDRIKELLGAKDAEILEELKNEFSSLFFLVYLHFYRTSCPEPVPRTKNIFYGDPKNTTFLSSFYSLKQNIAQAVQNRIREIEKTQTLKKATKDLLTSGLNRKLQDLHSYFDLFLDIFQSNEAKTLLINHNLEYFFGSAALENSEKSALPDLKKYTDYIHSLFSAAEHKRYCGFSPSNFFRRVSSFTKSLETLSLTEIPTYQQQLLSALTSINSFQMQNRSSFNEAEQGTLTHQKWLRNNNLQTSEKKDHATFKEMLYQNFVVCQLSKGLLEDVRRITEYRIFLERFSGDFLPGEMLEQRVTLNGSIIADSHLCHDEDMIVTNSLLRAVKEEVRSIFEPFLENIKQTRFIQTCSQIQLKDPNLPEFRDTEFPSSKKVFQFDGFFLEEFTPHIEALKDLQHTFPEKLYLFIQKLEEILVQEPELRSYTIKDIQDLLFQEMIPLFPMLILLKDVEQLKGGISPIISEELANFLALEGLVIPEREVLLAPSIDTNANPVQKLHVDTLVVPEKATPVANTRNSYKPEKKQQAKKESGTVFRSKNANDVMKRLAELGFIKVRQKGSHQIYKLQDSGPSVVVPIGSGKKELPIGTLKSIQNMTQQAIDSQKAGNIILDA